jgi:hypothetical protein
MLNALGCKIFCGTISATVVRIIPTVPELAPAKHLAVIAHAKDVEKPNSREADMVHSKPKRRTGLRPNLSDELPHAIPVRHWLREKAAAVMPAYKKCKYTFYQIVRIERSRELTHLATWFFGTLKLSIISGYAWHQLHIWHG